VSDQNKAIARRHIEEVWNKGNLSSMDETHAESYTHHDPHDPWGREHGPGTESLKKLVQFYRGAFPDLHLTLEETIAEGDVVAARFSSRGTHKNDCGSIQPTNRTVTLTGAFWWRFAGGKIVESRSFYDAKSFLQQLGAVPKMAELL
jgi:steroid delta-isomerase-like uncharacterized protein